MKPRVHVAARVPAAVESALGELFDLAPEPDGVAGLVAIPSVRVDNVDLEAAGARGVVVTNTPDVLTAATAEHTLALMLALLRRVVEGDRLLRRREPWRIEPTFMLGRSLFGRTLGVVGAGRIGGEVTRLAAALGMRVTTAGRDDALDEVLAADVVSLHVPLTAATHHLIDDDALQRMEPAAVLVNTSRGAVVDEEALVRSLRAGGIAGAALDVFEDEPRVHPGLLELDNVVLTPHIGSATQETREAMGMLCVDALRAVLVERRRPEHVVA